MGEGLERLPRGSWRGTQGRDLSKAGGQEEE